MISTHVRARPSGTCPTSLRSPEPLRVSSHSGDGQARIPRWPEYEAWIDERAKRGEPV